MRPNNKHSNLDDNSPLAQADRTGRPGQQIDRNLSIGVWRLVSCLRSVIHQGTDWISRWHNRRTGIHRLQVLNNHYLKDIGLDRCEIASYVEDVILMDTRTKYKAGKNSPDEYSNRNGLNEIHCESITSTEDRTA